MATQNRDEVPAHVMHAVAGVVAPGDDGALVHKVMVAAYRATLAGPPSPLDQQPPPAPPVRYHRFPGQPAHIVQAVADCCSFRGEARVIGAPGWLDRLALDLSTHTCTPTEQNGASA